MALNLLTELSKYVTADIILDRILPYMVSNELWYFFQYKTEFFSAKTTLKSFYVGPSYKMDLDLFGRAV